MSAYMPAAKILPEYTDVALREQRFFKGHAAEQMLRVPALYRQAVQVEVDRRSTRTESRDRDAISILVADPEEVRGQVIAEVLAQLAVPDAG